MSATVIFVMLSFVQVDGQFKGVLGASNAYGKLEHCLVDAYKLERLPLNVSQGINFRCEEVRFNPQPYVTDEMIRGRGSK